MKKKKTSSRTGFLRAFELVYKPSEGWPSDKTLRQYLEFSILFFGKAQVSRCSEASKRAAL